jgi:hypothetical protein
MQRNRNISNGNTNKPPRARKGHGPSKGDSPENVNMPNTGPKGAVFHPENHLGNEGASRVEQTKFGDQRSRINSAIIQQRDVDGDSTGGRKGKK